MQVSRANSFHINPPSIYPEPVFDVPPAFETSYGAEFCFKKDKDVFRKSQHVTPSSNPYQRNCSASSAAASASSSASSSPAPSSSSGYIHLSVSPFAESAPHTAEDFLKPSRKGSGPFLASSHHPQYPLYKPATTLSTAELEATQPSATLARKGVVGVPSEHGWSLNRTTRSTSFHCTDWRLTATQQNTRLDYGKHTASADPRRAMFDTLRDVQNARFRVYKRAYGVF